MRIVSRNIGKAMPHEIEHLVQQRFTVVLAATIATIVAEHQRTLRVLHRGLLFSLGPLLRLQHGRRSPAAPVARRANAHHLKDIGRFRTIRSKLAVTHGQTTKADSPDGAARSDDLAWLLPRKGRVAMKSWRISTLMTVLLLTMAVPTHAQRADATCDEHATQADAQAAADTDDADADGRYCESLPCPCADPLPGSLSTEQGAALLPAEIKKRTTRRAVALKEACRKTATNQVTCKRTTWRDSTYEWSGTWLVRLDSALNVKSMFSGTRAKRSCLKRKTFSRCAESKHFREMPT